MFDTQAAGYSAISWSMRVGTFQALDEINNKTDGVADELLPATQLQVAYGDSKCDATTALTAALRLTRDSFRGEGVSAIIGASCSGASVPAAQVAGASGVPIISPTSSSPSLSNGLAYPYFLRVAASDAFATIAMVDVLRVLFNYTSVALVHSADSYGAGGADAFGSAASASGLSIVTTQRFTKDATDFSAEHRALRQSAARVIVLFCQPSDGGRFLRTALEAGVGGAGYLWFGGDAVANSGLWEGDAVLSSDAVLRERVLRGFFSIAPNGQPQDSALYQGYLARRRELPPTLGDGTTCNLEADDDGTYLWAQDHDNN
eukprot:2947385-Prymnesium_polylepis.1